MNDIVDQNLTNILNFNVELEKKLQKRLKNLGAKIGSVGSGKLYFHWFKIDKMKENEEGNV